MKQEAAHNSDHLAITESIENATNSCTARMFNIVDIIIMVNLS